ncbi:unnamed protein product [Calicophoron daubneyi]|uniref:Xenotropic and polytropic retrovirus receptor 1 n=1 Tax=Calicophoron daubneyi TaxID=300641 RepID=A0AAV2T125_CALDB
MKFAAKLTAHLTPEWRKQYIDYEELKEFLYKSIQDIDRVEDWTPEQVQHLDECDLEFFEICEDALHRVDNFFAEKLAEAKRKYDGLIEELDSLLEAEFAKSTSRLGDSKISLSRRRHESVKRSISGRNDSVGKDSVSENLKIRSSFNVDLEGRQSVEGVRNRRLRSNTPAQKKKAIPNNLLKKEKKTYRKIHDLKLAFSEFYLSLVLLQNYQTLNFTGFRKILKKHDKLFRRNNGLAWHHHNVEPASFNTNREVDDLIAKVEAVYTEKLEQGDRQKAMKRLRVPPLAERHSPMALFRFGFFAGVFTVQAIVIILVVIFLRPLPADFLPALRIFRATFLTILFLCLFGLNTYGWRSSGVNNVLIFELNPRSHLDQFQLLEAAFLLAMIWASAVIYFLFSEKLNSSPYISPFILVITMILFLINPFKFGYHRARRWLLRVLGRIARAPFVPVAFADFWLADQLNSLSFILPELARFVCFYSSQVDWSNQLKYLPLGAHGISAENSTVPECSTSEIAFVANSCQCNGLIFGLEPLLRTLPAWFRFAQCLRRYHDMEEKRTHPHIVNAGKYSASFFVTASMAWYALRPGVPSLVCLCLSYFVNSSYTYAWDTLMDWGLMERKSENKFLRDELVYRYKAYYYAAIVEDFILRFAWVFRVSFEKTHPEHLELVKTILLTAEVVRRFIWNFFRLENEHLNNCGEFRAVRDIFITPLPKRPVRAGSLTLLKNFHFASPKSTILDRLTGHRNTFIAYDLNTEKSNNERNKKAALPDEDDAVCDVNSNASQNQQQKCKTEQLAEVMKKHTRVGHKLFKIKAATTGRLHRNSRGHHRSYPSRHHIMDNVELNDSISPIHRAVQQIRSSPFLQNIHANNTSSNPETPEAVKYDAVTNSANSENFVQSVSLPHRSTRVYPLVRDARSSSEHYLTHSDNITSLQAGYSPTSGISASSVDNQSDRNQEQFMDAGQKFATNRSFSRDDMKYITIPKLCYSSHSPSSSSIIYDDKKSVDETLALRTAGTATTLLSNEDQERLDDNVGTLNHSGAWVSPPDRVVRYRPRFNLSVSSLIEDNSSQSDRVTATYRLDEPNRSSQFSAHPLQSGDGSESELSQCSRVSDADDNKDDEHFSSHRE